MLWFTVGRPNGRTIACPTKMHRSHKTNYKCDADSAPFGHFFFLFFFWNLFRGDSEVLSRDGIRIATSENERDAEQNNLCVHSSAHFDDCIVRGCARMTFGGDLARFEISESCVAARLLRRAHQRQACPTADRIDGI